MFGRTAQTQEGDAASGKVYPFRVSGKSAVVMSDYHICKYDAILGVLVCIGDDADVLVLGREMCRELLPLPRGMHWLDAFVYTGTTSFLALCPETLLCMDYSAGVSGDGDSALRCAGPGAQFTCLHVAQGLTCGVVGRKDGWVSYFRLDPVSNSPEVRPQLRWTALETNVLNFCLPFCAAPGAVLDTTPASRSKFFAGGSLLSIDSYPNNPNALIGVVAGVPGVCKWYVDENRLSCFFDARTIADQPDALLATCRVTPGGVYVAAVTMRCTKVLLWNESKKRRDKVADLYWVVDLTQQITQGVPSVPGGGMEDAFAYNEYRVGLNMARTALDDSFRATNDKHSQMYLLLHGQRDILEVVVRLDDKQVMRQDAIIAHLNAYTAQHGVEAARTKKTSSPTGTGVASTVENYFNVFHVEPCVLSNYWTSGLTDVDLEALFVTSEDGLRPILAKRNRQTGGIESIRELRELNVQAPWYPRALLLRLPANQIRAVSEEAQRTAVASIWEKMLRGGDTLLRHALPDVEAREETSSDVAQLWRQSVMVTVTDAAQAVCLSPQSNEAFSVSSRALVNCVPWSTLAIGQDPEALVLEAALPSLRSVFLPTEIILRVYSTESIVTVMKHDIRRNTGSLALDLDRASLQLDGPGEPKRRMVQQAVLVNARLEPSRVTSKVSVFKDGKCLLLLLEDSSVALVDLAGKGDDGRPYMLQVPAGLLPVGATIASLDAFWMANAGNAATTNLTGLLCLACLFKDQKGFLLWNLSDMRMITYSHPDYAAAATRLVVTAAAQPPLPNLSGDVKTFDVTLSVAAAMQTAGEYGSLTFCDAIGSALFSLSLAFGVTQSAALCWCYRQSVEEEWVALPPAVAATRQIVVHSQVTGNALEWSIVVGGTTAATGSSPLQGSIMNAKTSWTCGKANLAYDTDAGEMRNYEISRDTSANDRISPALAFVGPHEIAVVQVSGFFPAANSSTLAKSSSAADAVPAAVCRLDPARRLEHFSVYHGRGALIVVTRDANGWRWVNILDSRSAKPMMQPYATLDFVGEENVQVLLVEIDNVLHLYFLGSNSGVVGHFFVEANLGASKESSVRKHPCFQDPRYHFTPSTFRGYGRYLPPAPTLKQETGFFKRLMTLPWEDIALKLESETLRATKAAASLPPSGSAPAPPPSVSAAAARPAQANPEAERHELLGSRTSNTSASVSAPPTAAARPGGTTTAAAPLPAPALSGSAPAEERGGRYVQLKAIAESQNVSLTEARRMMSENVRKLQERGERLNEVENRSAELAQNALTFQDLARQLKEKQRSSWL
ncbi:putative R-SNARE protein [Leptomonas pyrrhocoris]|uniref:Putative R-SNARE protein n=1 Tax=Leptomonas pyrrhocoris TaxID=157538 RepID=A0A0N0DZ23_LEPPY|nr:putative R-SNARE protein [Leptomonas pyrrhocoris]KPA84795.1 putative R-SNARE protein [Leptomonas pyrrhocoris]|eukprot:XP_015663234.1 putative R-SNARE protein [Leptomonas pyrrhocoris]